MLAIAGVMITLAIPFCIMKLNGNNIEQAQSLCPFKLLTGLPCPGCGITKSFIFLYEGDLAKSFHYHLFGPFVVVFCVFLIVLLIAEIILQKEYCRSILYNKKLSCFLGITLIVYHLYRVIDFVYMTGLHEIIRQSIWG